MLQIVQNFKHHVDKARLENAGLFIYPGAIHGYMQPWHGDNGYYKAAANASWDCALRVLNSI